MDLTNQVINYQHRPSAAYDFHHYIVIAISRRIWRANSIQHWEKTQIRLRISNLGRCNTFTSRLGQSLLWNNWNLRTASSVHEMNNAAIIISSGIPALSRSKRKEKKVEKIVSLRRKDSLISYTKRLSCCGQTGRSFRRFLVNMW